MRGPCKSLPKYRKHKPSGQAVVTLSGNDFYLGPHGTRANRLEYDRLIGEWLANSRQLPGNEVLSVSELCAASWQFARTYYVKNVKPTDEQSCIRIALRQLN